MIILSIETSCDETAVAVIKRVRGKSMRFEVLSHKILSQIDLHKQYGGVFPALAKREHSKAITQLIVECLSEADILVERTNDYFLEMSDRTRLENMLTHEPEMLKTLMIMFEGIQKPNIDAIAVTRGPGLEPALWVGINAASAMSMVWNIPLYPIHHMEAHIVASLLTKKEDFYEITEPKTPAVALLISGGHTELVRLSKLRKYKIIGETKDDAVGESFDKVARMINLPYPGGPEISRLSEHARQERIIVPEDLRLPRPMINSGNLDFSFSGLKTAVLTRVKRYEGQLYETIKKSIAMEFENAVTDVLVSKCKQAIYETSASTLIVGGGVSANNQIRFALKELAKDENVELFMPDVKLSGDNGIMIAATGLLHITNEEKPKVKLKADGNWSIEEA